MQKARRPPGAQPCQVVQFWPFSSPSTGTAPQRFVVPKGYDERLDHFTAFFDSVRNGTPVYEDATFGFRAAAPALLANTSYREARMIGWDPEGMTEVR